jgi:hypothetical protein
VLCYAGADSVQTCSAAAVLDDAGAGEHMLTSTRQQAVVAGDVDNPTATMSAAAQAHADRASAHSHTACA